MVWKRYLLLKRTIRGIQVEVYNDVIFYVFVLLLEKQGDFLQQKVS